MRKSQIRYIPSLERISARNSEKKKKEHEMQITKFSKNGQMVKIGKDEDNSKWYFLADPVQRFVKGAGIDVGQEVGFDVDPDTEEEESSTIVKIYKKGSGGGSGGGRSSYTGKKSGERSGGGSGYTGSAGQTESIKRAVTLKAAVDAAGVLQGHLGDINEVSDAVLKFYDVFYEKLSE